MLFGLATLSLAPSDEGAVSEADWGRDTPEVRLFSLSLRQNLRFDAGRLTPLSGPLFEGAVSEADWGSSWVLETNRSAARC